MGLHTGCLCVLTTQQLASSKASDPGDRESRPQTEDAAFYSLTSEVTYCHFCCMVLVMQTNPSIVWKATNTYKCEHQKARITGAPMIHVSPSWQNTLTFSQGLQTPLPITSPCSPESLYLNQVWVQQNSLSTVFLNLLACELNRQVICHPHTQHTVVGEA